jgi:hypothetical protein
LFFSNTCSANEAKRLRPMQLQADQDAPTAIQNLGNYQPADPTEGAEKLGTALSAIQTAQQTEVNAAKRLAEARDSAVAAEWGFHNAMLGTKGQVVAQSGDDSDAVQSQALTRKSEYQAPARRAQTAKA